MAAVALALLLATRLPFARPTCLPSDRRQAFGAAAAASGAAVREGGFAFWHPNPECVTERVDCGNANPTSPYAFVSLPSPYADASQTAQHQPQLPDWSLTASEVVVVWQCAPSRSRYFGWTPYIHTRVRDGRRYTVFASLGDTASAGTQGPSSTHTAYSRVNSTAGPGALPFDHDAVLLMGASPEAVAAVKTLLLKQGLPAAAVTVLPIPARHYRQGDGSTFSLYQRYALPEREELWQAWMRSPPVNVWSVTPQSPPARGWSQFTATQLIPKRGFSEMYLEEAAAALLESVRAHFAATPGAVVATHDDSRASPLQSSAFCIEAYTNCGGDNRDTCYVAAQPQFMLPAAPQSLVVVVGANHQATGNGVYANLALYDSKVRLGVTALSDDQFRGSAARWLFDSPFSSYADKLYAVALSRSCPPQLDMLCVTVPSQGFPSVPLEHFVSAVERPYAATDTTVGPDREMLLLPKLVLVNIAYASAPPTAAQDLTLHKQIQRAREGMRNMRTVVEDAAARVQRRVGR